MHVVAADTESDERDGVILSEFYATEKLIGGLVLVGIGSLLVWNADQSPGSNPLDLIFRATVIVGALLSTIGLFELVTGHHWHADNE